jgi:hypothetical protein
MRCDIKGDQAVLLRSNVVHGASTAGQKKTAARSTQSWKNMVGLRNFMGF